MPMTGINAIAMVILGIVLLSASIAGGVRLRREVPPELRRRWTVDDRLHGLFRPGLPGLCLPDRHRT